MQLVKGRRMKIHETHQIGTTEIDGNQYRHCKACGAVGSYTNALVMEAPCAVRVPRMRRFDLILGSAFITIAIVVTIWAVLAGHTPDTALIMGCVICALIIDRTRRD
jgi:hypothetical protein